MLGLKFGLVLYPIHFFLALTLYIGLMLHKYKNRVDEEWKAE